MYIFELINKLKNRKNEQETVFDERDSEPGVETEELEDVSICDHVFMPIDSTKTVLACSKCGFVIKNNKVKFSELDKNPFKF